MVSSPWDHKLTIRVDGIGLTLEPTNGLVMALDEQDFVQTTWPAAKSLATSLGTHLGLCTECLCSDFSSREMHLVKRGLLLWAGSQFNQNQGSLRPVLKTPVETPIVCQIQS